ncbi:helix-turn-helix transcriptional regulator [Cereibacter johrii]|uniref:helix-turn-helix transcriptional regulator n=1 Tax=Cereibacter johrii TaxID=445629 RepID=UPI002B26116C|nr:helix-turn-helix transcriptional regulator [Cereibacter johrii]MEA5163080.1 helix-turn-helix transcriptional regulator [Cereibacter johrii]
MRSKFAHSELTRKAEVRYVRLAFRSQRCQEWPMRVRLKELRKAKNLTQEQLAEMVGSSKSYISEIESGKKFPSGRLLKAFAHTMEVPVQALIEDDQAGTDLMAHLEVMRDLPEHDQKAVIRHAIGLLEHAQLSPPEPRPAKRNRGAT